MSHLHGAGRRRRGGGRLWPGPLAVIAAVTAVLAGPALPAAAATPPPPAHRASVAAAPSPDHVPAAATASPHAGGTAVPTPSYDSGLAPTPYMGWNTYFGLGAPTEGQVESVANFLISSGLRDSGYDYVWLDGGWQASPPRDAQGELAADPARFPSGIPALVDWLHARGLKAGIYTDAGDYDPSYCGLASGGHDDQDAREFASWKIDAIKVDFLCGIGEKADPGPAFTRFSQAVADSGRPMLLNLCNPLTDDWGVPHTPQQDAGYSYVFGPSIADSWRTGTDVAFGTPTAGEWPDILRNLDADAAHPEANTPGHYNDPDYLIPMRRLGDGSLELTQEESTTQLVMWAESAAPLMIGSDPRTLPQGMIDTLENPEIIAVDQDPLDIQGVRVAGDTNGDVYSKVLSGGGSRAVVLLNRSDASTTMTVSFDSVGLGGGVAVRDLRARADRGTFTGSYSATVPAHGTAMLKLTGADALPGSDLGGPATADPALVRFDDTDAAAFTRGANGSLTEQTLGADGWSGRWSDLGGPVPGGIVGQPAAYAAPGGRIDVFVRGADSQAYQRTYAGGQWGPWTGLGGSITDAPTVSYQGPDSWTLFATGADGAVWQRGPASGWSGLGTPSGLGLYGRPSAVTDGSTTYLAVRATDDSVWLRTRAADGGWSDWTGLGGTVSGSPTLVSTLGRVYLFARASDYTLWQRDFTDGAWGDWFPRDELPSDAFADALGATSGADGSAWIALRGIDGRVHQLRL